MNSLKEKRDAFVKAYYEELRKQGIVDTKEEPEEEKPVKKTTKKKEEK